MTFLCIKEEYLHLGLGTLFIKGRDGTNGWGVCAFFGAGQGHGAEDKNVILNLTVFYAVTTAAILVEAHLYKNTETLNSGGCVDKNSTKHEGNPPLP